MIRIVEPVSGQRFKSKEVVRVVWETDIEYGTFDIYYRTQEDTGWHLLVENIPGEARSCFVILPDVEGVVYLKVAGSTRKTDSFVCISAETNVFVYRMSSKVLVKKYQISGTKNPRQFENSIGVIRADRVYILSDKEIKVLPARRVMQEKISGEEISVQQEYIPSSVERYGAGYVITEYTDNRFYSVYTDENGIFTTDKIFNCGYVGISPAKEIGGKSDFSLYWSGDIAINMQNLRKVVSGIGLTVEVFHEDVSGIEFTIPYSKEEGEIYSKTIVEVKTIEADGASIPDTSVLGGRTNENGVYIDEFYYTETSEKRIVPQKEGYIFRPTSETIQLEGQEIVKKVFIGERVYSITILVVGQKNVPVSFPVNGSIRNLDTGEVDSFTFDGGRYSSGKRYVAGTYEVIVSRENMPFHPQRYIIRVEDDTTVKFTCRTYSITGRVRDFNGNPSSGVKIVEEGGNILATTDENGNYVIEGLPVREITIYAVSEVQVGYRESRKYYEPVNRKIFVNGDVTDQDFYELPTYKATGQILNRASGIDIEDAYSFALLTDSKELFYPGEPDAGFLVNDIRYSDRGWYFFSIINSEGESIAIENLPPARYLLVFLKTLQYRGQESETHSQNFGWTSLPVEREFRIVSSNVSGLDFEVYSGKVEGRITLSDGTPVENAPVELVGGEYLYEMINGRIYQKPKQTKTGADGKYVFDKQIPSSYEIYPLTTKDFWYWYDKEKQQIEITYDSLVKSGIDFIVYPYPAYSITGKVQSGEYPISEWIIAEGFEYQEAKVGFGSSVRKLILSGLSSPEYSIQAPESTFRIYPSGRSLWSFIPKEYKIVLDENKSGLDFEGYRYDPEKEIPVPEGYNISGKVLDIFNRPASGVPIMVGSTQVLTDENGNYFCSGLQVGTYVIYPACLDVPEQYRRNYTFADTSKYEIKITNRDLSGLDFLAFPKYSISGRVIDREGNPLEGISVLFNQHHSRMVYLSGNDIAWVYDEDLFEPERVLFTDGNFVLTNKGKHNVLVLDESRRIVNRIGSDEPANGIPGFRSGLETLSFPTYANYRGGVFSISDTGNNRFLLAKSLSEKLYSQNFENLKQVVASEDKQIDIAASFVDGSYISFYDYFGRQKGIDAFTEKIDGFDIKTFKEEINDFTEGICASKRALGEVEFKQMIDVISEETKSYFAEIIEKSETETKEEILNSLNGWKNYILSLVVSWSNNVINVVSERIEEEIAKYRYTDTEEHMESVLNSIKEELILDFQTLLQHFLEKLEQAIDNVITYVEISSTPEERKAILQEGQQKIMNLLTEIFDEVLRFGEGRSPWEELFSALINCVFSRFAIFSDFIEQTISDKMYEFSIENYRQNLIELLNEEREKGTITQEQYEEIIEVIERSITTIKNYLKQVKSTIYEHITNYLITVIEKIQEELEKVEEKMFEGVDVSFLQQVLLEVDAFYNEKSSSETSYYQELKNEIISQLEQQKKVIEEVLRQYGLEKLVDYTERFFYEFENMMSIQVNMLDEGIRNCIKNFFDSIKSRIYREEGYTAIEIGYVSGYIVEKNRDIIVTSGTEIVWG